jgi:aryl-alcohol dehydrogenase-like predicted oxidoreductase
MFGGFLEYANLGQTDLKTSLIGLGTGFRAGITKDSSKVVGAALDQGVILIDTAEIYGDGLSEKLVGEVIKGRRDEVVLVTKVSGDHLKYDEVLKSAEGSLRRLDTNFIDLYLVHWPNPNVPLSETMRAMERLVSDGKVRYIGVSNFDVEQLKKANEGLARYEIIANEVKYNLLEREVEDEVLPFCQKEEIAVLAYGPLARGLLTGRFTDENSIPGDDWRSRDWFFKGKSFKKGLEMVEVLKEIGADYGKSAGQVAINWLLAKRMVFPIFGASNVKQIEENCGAADWSMDKAAREKLSVRKSG